MGGEGGKGCEGRKREGEGQKKGGKEGIVL